MVETDIATPGWPPEFDSLPVAVAVFDHHGHVLGANQALGELLDYAHADLMRLTATDLLDSQDQASDLTTQASEMTRDQRRLVNAHGQRVFCAQQPPATSRWQPRVAHGVRRSR